MHWEGTARKVLCLVLLCLKEGGLLGGTGWKWQNGSKELAGDIDLGGMVKGKNCSWEGLRK